MDRLKKCLSGMVHLKVYFGYRLPDGTLVVNALPIEITID